MSTIDLRPINYAKATMIDGYFRSLTLRLRSGRQRLMSNLDLRPFDSLSAAGMALRATKFDVYSMLVTLSGVEAFISENYITIFDFI